MKEQHFYLDSEANSNNDECNRKALGDSLVLPCLDCCSGSVDGVAETEQASATTITLSTDHLGDSNSTEVCGAVDLYF